MRYYRVVDIAQITSWSGNENESKSPWAAKKQKKKESGERKVEEDRTRVERVVRRLIL